MGPRARCETWAGRWARYGVVVLCLAVLGLALAPGAARAANPHGGNTTITRKCKTCHVPHGSEGELLNLPRGSSVDEFCYTCHDGSGSVFNVRMAFDRYPSAESSHPVSIGEMGCADCHTPHQGPEEGNPRSLSVGPSNEATGNAVCGSCHGTVSARGGDIAARYDGTAHDTSVTAPASGSQVKCLACHLPHSSDNIALVRETIVGASGTTHTVEATPGAGARPVCEACHDVADGLWRGPDAYGSTRHGTVTTSTLAAVVPTLSLESTITTGTWPAAGDCDTCHEPHGTGQPFMARAAGDRLCTSCHDAPGAVKPSGYSYQGYTDYLASPHGAIEQTRTGTTRADGCNVCHAVHGGGTPSVGATAPAGLLWRYEGDLCTGSGDGGCHADGSTAAGGTDIRAALQAGADAGTRHDILPADQNATGARLQCSGCHNPHGDTSAAVYSDPDSIGTTMPVGFSEYVGPSGEVYALVGAEHDGVAPVVPATSLVATSVAGTMTVEWTTNEPATSWVDWGTTASYELGTLGSPTLATAHSVELTPVAPGDYYFRIRSADALGNQFTSSQLVLNPTAVISGPPVLTPQPDHLSGINGTPVTFTWAPVTVSDGHAPQYLVEARSYSGTVVQSGWIAGTTWTSPRLARTQWTWTVRARDPFHANAWSISESDTFSIDYWEIGLATPSERLESLGRGFYAPVFAGELALEGVQVAAAEPVEAYSVDTDFMAVETRSRNAPTASYAPLAGWETSSSAIALPTPLTPGTPVAGATLARTSSMDDVYWRTDRATVDRSWNWQMARFDITPTAESATELVIRWDGHGEPTTGYATRLYLWNRVTGQWTQVFSRTALGTDSTVLTAAITSVTDSFCLRCHDGAVPTGTVIPAGVTNVSATWSASSPSDFHGPRVGDGVAESTGGLAAGYSRGDAIACSVCHDPHGTSNPNMAPLRVNGVTTDGLANGNRVSELCHGCHTGAATDWHAGCISCHLGLATSEDHVDPNVNLSDTSVCTDCHRHGSETKWGTGGLTGAPGCSRGAAHSAGCHTWATTF